MEKYRLLQSRAKYFNTMGVGLHFCDSLGKEVDSTHFTYSHFCDWFLEHHFPQKKEEYIMNESSLVLYGRDARLLYKLCWDRGYVRGAGYGRIDHVEIS